MYLAVPPPPSHEPPRCPLDKKSSIDSPPPPLPPSNPTGRRSHIYTNKMKHEILQKIHDGPHENPSKLITEFFLNCRFHIKVVFLSTTQE